MRDRDYIICSAISDCIYDMGNLARIPFDYLVEFALDEWDMLTEKDRLNDYQKRLYITGLMMDLNRKIKFEDFPNDEGYLTPVYTWTEKSPRITATYEYRFPHIDKK